MLILLSQGCSLVMLIHEDIYSGMVRPTLVLQMEYLADILIKAEPLATGLASDVHGQVLSRTHYCLSLFSSLCSLDIRNVAFLI